MSDFDGSELHVPARVIPVPTSVSPEARAFLALGPMPAPANPALDDIEGWRRTIAEIDEMVLGFLPPELTAPEGCQIDEISLDGLPVYVITPPGVEPDDPRVFLDAHGGAFIVGRGKVCRASGVMTALKVGMRVWSVDYRMPPDDPFPAAVDDVLTAYRALLRGTPPEAVVVGGISAGGNLAAALVLKARDEGLPLPAAAILQTPALDLTHSGDTWRTNLGVDTVITSDDPGAIVLYIGGHDPKDPYLSPLFGDFSKGFPPTILASGTRDVLLSDTVRMHRALRAAGMTAELHVLEAAPHGSFRGTAPEEREVEQEIRRFIDADCNA